MSTDSVYTFEVQDIDGTGRRLEEYRDRVLLIVNTASKCGFTPQYTGLEELYQEFKDRGFAVLGFPCNQFGQQEPGNAEEIKNFCSLNYNVTFPLFAKIDVNGENAHPLYDYLKKEKPGALGTKGIKWNFTKFLIDKQGRVVDRFGPDTKPEKIKSHIKNLLG